jgi:hypothetical protein
MNSQLYYSNIGNDIMYQFNLSYSENAIQQKHTYPAGMINSGSNKIGTYSPTIQWFEGIERENKMFSEIEFKKNFSEKVKNSDFEYGFLSEADEYLEKAMKNNGSLCLELIYELYCDNYDDEKFIIGLLKTLAHIPWNKITDKCIRIVKESLGSKSIDIKENAVMAFENWEYTDAIPLLENTRFNDSFLDDYLQGVIQDLKELRNGPTDQKD